MTCREFEHAAAAVEGLGEWSQAADPQMLSHAGQCHKCGGWLQRQRMLATNLGTLQAQTRGLEAGPAVEQALLREFRRKRAADAVQPVVTPRELPIAFRLSRFFEVGAYVAVAAALLVGIFLGVRLWDDRSRPVAHQSTPPVQQEITPTQVQPAQETTAQAQQQTASQRSVASAPRTSARHSSGNQTQSAPNVSQPGADDSYMALMFCDPLSCSTDAQLVRMEIPEGRDTQPQIADVVVGYDGVVRAVRFVN